ncbi:polyamine ABC transporter substrate-binding protein [Salinisphaera sp. G21_0]|uniref:polyamine ABC transporter substrate-binding protein n=1 Tax=Salinisphaera sp. G21_0 TaxID=2821094 RepID=UPI001AD97D2E|nr:polyamine ABC transporter substrate-binding protein [Salinisphaera sp. G21_0]MBO9481422.1 polyamine ABC transporter substrate-binding protein [Salinisphaera sp. G21_0]
MIRHLGKSVSTLVIAASLTIAPAFATTADEGQRTLNIYNWSDYIAEDTIANFEKETGIKVHYDVFDSNEVLEAKLLSGKTGYDIVAPTADFLLHQIKAGVYQPLDKEKLPNWKHLDAELMALMETYDPDNRYSFPYLWGTTGIGYNPERVKAQLGKDAPVNSWSLIFDEKHISKLSQCGVAFLNAPTDVIPAALSYLGLDPNSTNRADYAKAEALLMKVRPYVTYFHSSRSISDLANGDICVAMGWSGDILQAADRAAEADNGVTVKYMIPDEGAGLWFDTVAIPKDARNPEEAHIFLNYLLRPDVIANITDYVAYANPNKSATALVDDDIRENPGIYPTTEAKKRLFVFKVLPPRINRLVNRLFTKLTSGQ